MKKKLGKLLHDKFLDYPWWVGAPFDNSVAELISDSLVMHLNSRIRWRILQVVSKRLGDTIHEKLLEEIRSNAI